MRRTTNDFPIHRKYYYIIDFRNLFKAELLPYFFTSQSSAEKALDRKVTPQKRKYYTVKKGKYLTDHYLPYHVNSRVIGKFHKYEYPGEYTAQQKKAIRTRMRRRLRRMGMLSLVTVYNRFNKKPKKTQAIRNKQIVAMNKNSAAKVFQIDGENKKYFYVILRRSKSKVPGTLFKVLSLRVNIKTGSIKKVTIRTKRDDLLIPFLITELYAKLEQNRKGHNISLIRVAIDKHGHKKQINKIAEGT